MTKNYPCLFSIIIPAFNVEKYIHRAISSIITQNFHDYELIIVNDGSTDKTAEIIDGFARNNSKITVINHSTNESLHMARLNGVAAANGEYIIFLDGDDYFTENALTILHQIIETNQGYDIYEYGYISQPGGKIVLPSFSGGDRFLSFFAVENNPANTMWNKIYYAQLIKTAFAVMEKVYLNYSEDIYESIIISYYAKKYYSSKEIITNYTIGTGISTTGKNYDQVIECLQTIVKAINLVDDFISKTNAAVTTDNLSYRFMSYVISCFINTQTNPEVKKKLLLKLSDHFDTQFVLKYLINQELALTSKINAVTGSFNYKLGHTILQPIRRVTKLFKKRKAP